MWQEDGLSAEQIANFPGRSAAIKVSTAFGYVLDAAREGCVVDWNRLFKEIGLTPEIAASIQAAVLKVGSKDKLKPIKNEVPEEVEYSHIKAWLTMHELGMSSETISSGKEHDGNATETVLIDDDSPRKRQKVDVPKEDNSPLMVVTEASLVEWLQNFENGVTLSDILKRFNGSTETEVEDTLSCMEGEFLIFKKNNLYRLM